MSLKIAEDLKVRCDILADSIQQTVIYVTQLANTYASELQSNIQKDDSVSVQFLDERVKAFDNELKSHLARVDDLALKVTRANTATRSND